MASWNIQRQRTITRHEMQKVVLGFSHGFGTKRSLQGVGESTDVMTVGFFVWVILWNEGIPELKENLSSSPNPYLIHVRKERPRESAICPKSHSWRQSCDRHWCLLAAWDQQQCLGSRWLFNGPWIPPLGSLQGECCHPKTTLLKHTFQGTAINKVKWELTRTFPLCSKAKTYNWESSLGAHGPWVLLAGLLCTTLPAVCSDSNGRD